MALTSRRSRPLPRNVPLLRDARLFVVASEDTCAPKQYFSFFPHPRVHVEVLETHDGLSSPAHVINRLIHYAELYQIGEDDQLWALIDTDHWILGNHKANLIEAVRDARQRGYQVAMSNPCFDLWLLLHQRPIYPTDQLLNSQAVAEAIRETLGEFNKAHLKPQHYTPQQVGEAIQRARSLEPENSNAQTEIWPDLTGSRVYLLIEELRSAGLGFGGVP